MTALYLLGTVGLAVLTAVVTWAFADSTVGPVLRTRRLRKVVITTKGGASFRGLLVQADRNAFVLRGTEALGQLDGNHVLVDGELIVLRADIDYIQVP